MTSPPIFKPHPFIRGGHLQTFATTILPAAKTDLTPRADTIQLPDGDRIAIHDDCPPQWQPGDPSLLLVHGLAGCHQSSYMKLTAQRFYDSGVRAFRLDMRGCGASRDLASRLNHAGRGNDVLQAVHYIGQQTGNGPIWLAGISLGGNQVLKLLSELGNGLEPGSSATDRITRAATIAPPIDLLRCCENMLRPRMRPYNKYFISRLLKTITRPVMESPEFQALDLRHPPKTLYELDDRITAPLSGFQGATDYYQQSSTHLHLLHNRIPTLVLTAADDPIVPVACFRDAQFAANMSLEVTPGGGHVGYIAAGPQRHWLVQRLHHWFVGT